MNFFQLIHKYTDETHTSVKSIGFFSSIEEVNFAITYLKKLPGFCVWPDGFKVIEQCLDNSRYNQGFLYPELYFDDRIEKVNDTSIPDFEINYKFLPEFLSNLKNGELLKFDFDWCYEDDDPCDGVYRIKPEFLYEQASRVKHTEEDLKIDKQGMALMWIISPIMRYILHQDKILVGSKGFLMNGSKKVAEATVTRIIGLKTNPGWTGAITNSVDFE
jgi:hypothetical protein